MSRIAVMGSAFNPPSLGHKDVVEQALKQCDQVWLVPAFRHAWGKKMAAYQQRCEMVDLFVQDIADPRVSLCAIEHEIASDKPVYSYDLLAALQARIQTDDQLLLVIGPITQHHLINFTALPTFNNAGNCWSSKNAYPCAAPKYALHYSNINRLQK